MKVRISFVVDVSDEERRAISKLHLAGYSQSFRNLFPTKHLANRSQIKWYFENHGIVTHECGSLATEADHIKEREDCNARF